METVSPDEDLSDADPACCHTVEGGPELDSSREIVKDGCRSLSSSSTDSLAASHDGDSLPLMQSGPCRASTPGVLCEQPPATFCPHCGAGFTRERDLAKHMKKIHLEEIVKILKTRSVNIRNPPLRGIWGAAPAQLPTSWGHSGGDGQRQSLENGRVDLLGNPSKLRACSEVPVLSEGTNPTEERLEAGVGSDGRQGMWGSGSREPSEAGAEGEDSAGAESGYDCAGFRDDTAEETAHTGETLYSLARLDSPLRRFLSPYFCDACGKCFKGSGTLKRHQRIHTGESPFHCAQCGKNFKDSGALKRHQRIHTGELPYHCTQCEKKFRQLGHLKEHQRIHTGETPFNCSQCCKSFSQLGNLKTHQRIHTGETPYRCDDCGKSFRQIRQLRTHQQVHTGQTPFCCAECGKVFKWMCSLKEHQRIHTGECPFECQECGKRFKGAGTLKKHRRIHTGETPYRCAQCGKGFKESGALRRHQRIHSGETPYHCGLCSKKFSRVDHLKDHQRVHGSEN
ncbi:zinc finger protein ZFP2 isoform X2 [Amia ocellicauda]